MLGPNYFENYHYPVTEKLLLRILCLFFGILLFLHPHAPGRGRQFNVSKSMAKLFHAGMLFFLKKNIYFFSANKTALTYYKQILVIGINSIIKLQRSK